MTTLFPKIWSSDTREAAAQKEWLQFATATADESDDRRQEGRLKTTSLVARPLVGSVGRLGR